MIARRPFQAPPRWTEAEIVRDCRLALEAFVERRLLEEGRPYRAAFVERLRLLERLFSETGDLRELEAVAGMRMYLNALRYLAGPPLSSDDLDTLARARRFARVPAPVRATAIIAHLLDPLRFAWIGEDRAPTSIERHRALRWTAGLWAVETVRTGRRGEESRDQENVVAAVIEADGFVRQRIGRRVNRLDQVEMGCYTREVNLGGLKCDVSVRLHDGRLLALECKVSNSELNSVKRLIREAGGKAGQWQRLFGIQVVTAAVLRGVFRPLNVVSAQEDYGIAILWEHNLKPLRRFLRAAR